MLKKIRKKEVTREMAAAMTDSCALCNLPWDKVKNSKEHIIPESVGGRLTVSSFICENCNNQTGANWDAGITTQFGVISNMLGIKRQKGKKPSVDIQTASNVSMKLHYDGTMNLNEKPKPIETIDEAGQTGHVSFSARTNEQANRIAEHLRKKYEKKGYKKFSYTLTENEAFLTEGIPVDASFRGDLIGRSLVKSCLSLAHKNHIHIKDCNLAQQYLDSNENPCFGYYYTKDLLSTRPSKTIHCVSINGCPSTGMLLGYVEYFSYMRTVLCLSNNYTGKDFSNTYALDPATGKTLDVSVNLDFSADDIQDIYDYEHLDINALKTALNNIAEQIYKRSFDQQLKREIEKAYQQALIEHGFIEGRDLTQEEYLAFQYHVIQLLAPFFARQQLKQKEYRGKSQTA